MRLHRPFAVVREPWLVLAPLLLVQWGAVAAFASVVRHNGWVFYQGGDETFFYTASSALSGGHIPESEIGYAWSYLTSPISLVAGPSYLRALPALVLLQTVVLLPVALYCVYAIAARIGGVRIGYLAAALWVAAPFAAIPLWDQSYHAKYVEQFLPQFFGLTGLGDFPSMVCLLVAALLCFRALDSSAPLDAAAAGLAAGFAVGIKPANALFLVGPVLAFAAARRLRQGVALAVALVPALVALALWKYRGLGHLPVLTPGPKTAAFAAGLAPAAIVVDRYLHLDWSQFSKNYRDLRHLFAGFIFWHSFPLVGFLGAVRSSWPKALLLGGWLGAFVLVKGSSGQASIDGGTLLRLFMPGFPPLVILAALVPVFLLRNARMGLGPSGRAPLSRPIVGVAAIIFAALPIGLLAVLPPLRSPTAVKYFDENVFVPVDNDFSVRANPSRGGEAVSWKAPRAPGARVYYRVFRSRPGAPAPDPTLPPARDGIRCLAGHTSGYAGAADCRLEMTVLKTVRERKLLDHPPPGRWVYRVGLAANWRDDPTGGDVLLLSRAVRVLVRR
jgi:hypothetical protein